LNSVKSSDSGNFTYFTPNGFNGKEICSLARYAGISDKVSALGIFNHNNSAQEWPLVAQIIWYLLKDFIIVLTVSFGSRDNYIHCTYRGGTRWCFIKVIKQKDGGLKYLLFQMLIIN
jgi:hypothetical protein